MGRFFLRCAIIRITNPLSHHKKCPNQSINQSIKHSTDILLIEFLPFLRPTPENFPIHSTSSLSDRTLFIVAFSVVNVLIFFAAIYVPIEWVSADNGVVSMTSQSWVGHRGKAVQLIAYAWLLLCDCLWLAFIVHRSRHTHTHWKWCLLFHTTSHSHRNRKLTISHLAIKSDITWREIAYASVAGRWKFFSHFQRPSLAHTLSAD